MIQIIQISSGTKSSAENYNIVLRVGELFYETDTKKIKIGDGSTSYTSLRYIIPVELKTDGTTSQVLTATGEYIDISQVYATTQYVDDEINNLAQPTAQALNQLREAIDALPNTYLTQTAAAETYIPQSSAANFESTSNKVTVLDENSTDTQYPTAKVVYDTITENEFVVAQALNQLNNKVGAIDNLRNALIDAGYIELPEVTKSELNIDSTSKANAQVGWVAYEDEGVIKFAQDLPEGHALLGVAVDVANGNVVLVAPTDAAYDANKGNVSYRYAWAAKMGDGKTYATAVGTYDVNGDKISDSVDMTLPNASFTINANGSNTNVNKVDTDPDFQNDFGTATTEQRNLVMRKSKAFFAAQICKDYNPAPSKLNMKGVWMLPNINWLKMVRSTNDGATDAAFNVVQTKLDQSEGGQLFQSFRYYWSCLENSVVDSWNVDFSNGDINSYGKGYDYYYYVRAFTVL